MWKPGDRERCIGSYDPEHEMPDPDRDRGGRWQSDAYRSGARDSRYAYRWNPERFEDRFSSRRDIGREAGLRWTQDGRDYEREHYERGFEDGFERGYQEALRRNGAA